MLQGGAVDALPSARALVRAVAALLVLVATILVTRDAWAGGRRALLVGSSAGTPEQSPLRYTHDDVQRLSRVLTELGDVTPPSVVTLQDVTAAAVSAALDAMAADRSTRSDLFVFYYSGHASGSGLTLGTTTLDLPTLLAKVAAVPAELRVIVLDACQSGAAVRAKGVTVAPPVQVRIDTSDSSGLVVMSSSTAATVSTAAISGFTRLVSCCSERWRRVAAGSRAQGRPSRAGTAAWTSRSNVCSSQGRSTPPRVRPRATAPEIPGRCGSSRRRSRSFRGRFTRVTPRSQFPCAARSRLAAQRRTSKK